METSLTSLVEMSVKSDKLNAYLASVDPSTAKFSDYFAKVGAEDAVSRGQFSTYQQKARAKPTSEQPVAVSPPEDISTVDNDEPMASTSDDVLNNMPTLTWGAAGRTRLRAVGDRASKYGGTCQVCEREMKLPGGVLSKHGYTKPWGWYMGTCAGSGELPYEQSCQVIANQMIPSLKRTIAWAQSRIEDYPVNKNEGITVREDKDNPGHKEAVFVTIIPDPDNPRAYILQDGDEEIIMDARRKNQPRFAGAVANGLDYVYQEMKDAYLGGVRSTITQVSAELARAQTRVDEWSERPLIPVVSADEMWAAKRGAPLSSTEHYYMQTAILDGSVNYPTGRTVGVLSAQRALDKLLQTKHLLVWNEERTKCQPSPDALSRLTLEDLTPELRTKGIEKIWTSIVDGTYRAPKRKSTYDYRAEEVEDTVQKWINDRYLVGTVEAPKLSPILQAAKDKK